MTATKKTELLPCHCGFSGALAGMNQGTHLSLTCPECGREATAFTMPGLVEAWNKPAPDDLQEGSQ